jgi:ABC-type lipoprotein release transport system permease subunit
VPIAKAQAMTQTENHASTIFVMLKDIEQSDSVVVALQSSSYKVLTWTKMNEFLIQYENMANSYMVILYLIVLGIAATVIVNTLVMAVFERTREIGILSAIGMRSRTIMAMFLTESSLLAVGGILIGLILGLLVIAYLSKNGFNIESIGVTGMLIGNTIYTELTMEDAVKLTGLAFVVALLAGLYPAMLAARMEPVDALRSGK